MKKQRNQKIKSGAPEKLDLISQLPDSILNHILSFLDTRSGVATCVVSKHWNKIWTNVQVLDFKYDEHTTSVKYGFPLGPFSKFTKWVRHVLYNRENTRLTKFHLSVTRDVDPNFIRDCIVYAINHNVQQLKIRAFCNAWPAQLADLLFTCQSLTSLKLSNVTYNRIDLPRAFPFPNLKILRLSTIVFPNQNFNDIFLGCSNLETLVLYKCKLRASPELKVLEISCLKLKNLEILYWGRPYKSRFEGSIHVNAPELVSFTFKGLITEVQFLDDLPRLETVFMDLDYARLRSHIQFHHIDSRIENFLKNMLGKFHTMKFLSLSMNTVEVITRCTGLYNIPPKALEEVAEILMLKGAETKTQSATRDLQAYANLEQLKFTVPDKCAEAVFPVNTVKHLLECFKNSNFDLVLDYSKGDKLSPLNDVQYSFIKGKKQRGSRVTLSRDVITYYLKSSPLKSIVVEFPEAS